MPDRVQKEFVIVGSEALELASALGIPSDQSGDYSFPWEENTSECYQVGGGFARCDTRPTPVNTAHFQPGEVPRLTFSGTWLDTRTGNGNDTPAFQFSRRFNDNKPLVDSWAAVWRSSGEKLRAAKNHRLELFSQSAVLAVIEMGEITSDRWLTIGLDDREPALRKQSAEGYEKCLEYHRRHPDLDSGC
ncbi:MAG: hypothetical protein U0136_10100 [Bdellovibrionota bacterium]